MSTVLETATWKAATTPTEMPLTRIERRSRWDIGELGELWQYRELLFFLAWRDFKVRYKQTLLGVLWAVMQPVATMLAFTLFLHRLGSTHDPRVPYPLFVLSGLLAWTFVASAVSSASQSIVGNQNLITKVYFPRLLIPLGALGAPLIDLLVGMVVLGGVLLWHGVTPEWHLLMLPLFLLGLAGTAVGVGTFLAALTVAYRDFRYVVPFLVQLWMFATPSIYLQATAELNPVGQVLLLLNPLHPLISAFRNALVGEGIAWLQVAGSGLLSLALLIGGCWYFRRVERSFADII